MTWLAFAVLGPPVAKQRPRKGKGGHWYTPDETRAYEQTIAVQAMVAARAQRWKLAATPLDVTLRVYFRTVGKRQDLDNVAKAVLDGITKSKAVWDDDVRVASLHVLRDVSASAPRVEIRIEAAP